MILRILKKIIWRLIRFSGLPGFPYQTGVYFYRMGVTISPSHNTHLVKYPANMKLHEAFINAYDEVEIEENVIFGHQVMLLTGGHEYGEESVKTQAVSKGKITIKKGAWIASRAIILGGVTIGRGSVIGAGSVVTRSVPPQELWAGNPAKKIKSI